MKKLDQTVIEFLDHSNRIESVYTKAALEDAKKAWRHIVSLDRITPADIVDVHLILMAKLDPEVAGKFRSYPVRIGWQIKPFKGMEYFEARLKSMCDRMNDTTSKVDPEEQVKKEHVEYEDIHPFGDGNGRSGRIFYNWHRLRLGLPIHVIHEGDEQFAYYQWFKEVIPTI